MSFFGDQDLSKLLMNSELGPENIDGISKQEIAKLFAAVTKILEKGPEYYDLKHSVQVGNALFIAQGDQSIERYLCVDPHTQQIGLALTTSSSPIWGVTMEILLSISAVLPHVESWVKEKE